MELPTNVETVCNWEFSAGCALSEIIYTRITHEEIFIAPELDDVIKTENAVLLKKLPDSDPVCELLIRLRQCTYKIESISLVCTSSRLELFVGPLREYVETTYGSPAEIDDDGKVFSYRYDIQVDKSGVVEVMLKLPVAPKEEICIFGVLLQVAPNPNGITTGNKINLEHVQKLLSGSAQLSPGAEKCMLIMQAANNQGAGGAQWMPEISSQSMPASIWQAEMERRFDKLEQRMDTAIAEQNAKLDKIFKLLEKKNEVE